MLNFILGVTLFTAVILALVGLILFARSKLVASGDVAILINDEKTIHVPAGGKLLGALAGENLFVASACGGGATLVRVYEQRAERRAYAFFTVWATLGLVALFGWGLVDAAVGTPLLHRLPHLVALALHGPELRHRDDVPAAPGHRARRGREALAACLLRALLRAHLLRDAQVRWNRAGLGGRAGVHLTRLGIPEGLADPAIALLAVSYGAALVVTGWLLLRRGSPRDLLPAALIALSPVSLVHRARCGAPLRPGWPRGRWLRSAGRLLQLGRGRARGAVPLGDELLRTRRIAVARCRTLSVQDPAGRQPDLDGAHPRLRAPDPGRRHPRAGGWDSSSPPS